MRAMTIAGLCMFLDIAQDTWINWRKSRTDLSEVITRAEAVIFQQKFSGAAADLLNPSIIARDLGLAEKQDHTSSDGSMSPKPATFDLAKMTDEELEAYRTLAAAAGRDQSGD